MNKNYVGNDNEFRLFSALKNAEMFLNENNIEFAKLTLKSAITLFLILRKEWDEKRQRA